MGVAERVLAYHARSSHRPGRYAASRGFMDWANQPVPFRAWPGAPEVRLPVPEPRPAPTWDALHTTEPEPAGPELVARVLRLSLGLTAWKEAPRARPWSLRVPPSSGALYPVEAYVLGDLWGGPALHHYDPLGHRLVRRATLPGWELGDTWLVGLSSLRWRAAWKYGERSLRYVHLDLGHAQAAVAVAAAAVGWTVRTVPVPGDVLDRLLGVHLQRGAERERGEVLLALAPEPVVPEVEGLVPERIRGERPAPLSRAHHPWPVLDEVEAVLREGPGLAPGPRGRPPPAADRGVSAEELVLRRRSARVMDGGDLDLPGMERLVGRAVAGLPVLPWSPRLALAVWPHRVPGASPRLWGSLDGPAPAATPAQVRDLACHQGIAADGVLAAALLVDLPGVLREGGPVAWGQVHQEAGVAGHLLYLEAEAAGLAGTGIGCFFDELVRERLGLADGPWWPLYLFAVGRPVHDPRLRTLPAYVHLTPAPRTDVRLRTGIAAGRDGPGS